MCTYTLRDELVCIPSQSSIFRNRKPVIRVVSWHLSLSVSELIAAASVLFKGMEAEDTLSTTTIEVLSKIGNDVAHNHSDDFTATSMQEKDDAVDAPSTPPHFQNDRRGMFTLRTVPRDSVIYLLEHLGLRLGQPPRLQLRAAATCRFGIAQTRRYVRRQRRCPDWIVLEHLGATGCHALSILGRVCTRAEKRETYRSAALVFESSLRFCVCLVEGPIPVED